MPDQLPVAGTDLSRGNDLARNECFLSPPEQPEILLLMCVFIAPLCCMHASSVQKLDELVEMLLPALPVKDKKKESVQG